MKHLIIYAHPNIGSLNHHLMQTVIESLQTENHEIEVRDLYQFNFNPVLSQEDMNGQRLGTVADDVKVEQDYISWADHLTFIYPIWWTGMPAIMKGYIDRVFSYGFAYRYDQGIQKGLLTGKLTTIINTQGKSNAEYESIGMDKALSLTSDKGIFSYCGLTINRHFFFDKADRPTPESKANWTNQVSAVFKN
ncbi:Glutathione-regulated potassium-efflux system ancillary protein KefF [Dyadobacter sp. CECT 9275]|uniref:Glutathione-regulated potassium-efflux system ancillary protein KefF n=1 Tax=Dyadobacter helix TaxID=2822344 RepID=A0A916N6A5_9BACT|nr:NAD(P)H-dependent oxidoreductase [Dyadobacter sp. CECT 9275]CAG5002620.1 Glutathione-regulated potassium-efflux system ancillary protein KefF [Dyadobacter sp. CECT 9275]